MRQADTPFEQFSQRRSTESHAAFFADGAKQVLSSTEHKKPEVENGALDAEPGSLDVIASVARGEPVVPLKVTGAQDAATDAHGEFARMAALGRLAARVAHELNNPLDGILRYVNLALRVNQSGGDPRINEYLDKARGGLLRMAQITTGLLEFSRASHAPPEQATINRIVEDAIASMAGRATESGVTVKRELLAVDLPVARGSNIFQVFCNLIKNALDAMPDGGALAIKSQCEAGDVVIVFEDTGIGLPEEAERIFEPFFTTKAPGRGTGLGLAVCREIIERYGGSISANRRQPAGTAFVVRIPEKNCGSGPMAAKTGI